MTDLSGTQAMTSKQYSWVERIRNLQPVIDDKEFRVAKRDKEGKPTIQDTFNNVTPLFFPVDDHDIPPQLIIFEFDSPNREANYANSKKIEFWLKEREIPYFKNEYGGRSPHLWVFFKVSDLALKGKGYHEYREIIVNYILKECEIDINESGFDMGNIIASRHLIRSFTEDIPEKIEFWEISDQELKEIVRSKTEKEGQEDGEEGDITILLDGYSSQRIHPALDFVNSTCYLGNFLPAKDGKGKEGEMLCILTDGKELFPAVPEELDERKISLRHKPIRFQPRISLDAIKRLASTDPESNTPINASGLFNAIRQQFKRYVEFPIDAAYDLFSLWVIGTYLHPLFRTYPYLYLGGIKESGKTKTLMVVDCLAFNSIFSSNMSVSSVFRFIQNSRCTLLIDETEKLINPERAQEFRSILLSGYKRGSRVHRSEKNRRDRFEPIEFESYSPKIVANIRGLEDVLESRCISFIMRRTLNKKIGDKEVNIEDPIWQELRDNLYVLTLTYWKEIREIYEGMENETNLSNREWELWHPILTMAKFIDPKIYEDMLELAKLKSGERQTENITETGEYVLVETLLGVVGEDAYYKVKEIQETMEGKFDGEEKWLNTKWIGRALGRLGFTEKRRVGTGVEYRLKPEIIRDLAERLGIQIRTTQSSQTTQTTPNSEVSVDQVKLQEKPKQEATANVSEVSEVSEVLPAQQTNREKFQLIEKIIREGTEKSEDGLTEIVDVELKAQPKDISRDETARILGELKDKGIIYEPKHGYISLAE